MKLSLAVAVVVSVVVCGCVPVSVPQSYYFNDDFKMSVKSPDKRNEICLYDKPLSYEVRRDGAVVAARAPIDLIVNGIGLATTNLVWEHVTSTSVPSTTLATPVYKKSSIDLACEKGSVTFNNRWGVELVARNDGVAYRIVTHLPGKIQVTDEVAPLAIPDANDTCWVGFLSRSGSEQTSAQTVRAGDFTNRLGRIQYACMPLVYEHAGKTVVVTDADVADYPLWYLEKDPVQKSAGLNLRTRFWRFPTETKKGARFMSVQKRGDFLVETEGTRTFPWRAFVLADTPMQVAESDLVYALSRPAEKGTDFSWVKPGKVMWDWFNDWNLDGAKIDFKAGCNTKTYEYYIDFASTNNLEYVIFDEGWSARLDIWHDNPKVDVKHLIDYGAKRNVGIILWMAWAQAYGDEEHVAEHFAKLGAKGFKVDFIDRFDADAERFMWKFAAACAKHKMLVDYHGCPHPTGMQRMYPNVLNYESVHGLETMKFYRKGDRIIDNDVKILFQRMTAGPLDYTPGGMDNYPLGAYKGTYHNPGSLGTRARQMAMMVLYEAPIQMLCDTPAKYAKNMESFNFMAKVPVTWQKVVALGGHPDAYGALARQAKDGTWYAAALNNEKACDVAFDTAFLGTGTWQAEIFRDTPNADQAPRTFIHETKSVKAGDKLSYHLAPAGGFVIHFTPSK